MPNPGISALEILKHTDRSNCGECGVPTCMAFCALVAAGQKNPDECPHLGEDIKEKIRQKAGSAQAEAEDRLAEMIRLTRERFREVDFEEAAARLDGWINKDRLAFRCLGKIFELDRDGRLYSQCHVNNWVYVPLLQYVFQGKGLDPTSEWVTFRELKESRDWKRFFNHRCHAPMLRMADRRPRLFLDIIELFGQVPRSKGPVSEYAVVLKPLPKVPLMICYTPQDGPFESTLSIFFDRTIEGNLKPEATYILGAGLAEMIGRIIEKHDLGEDPLRKVEAEAET